MYFQFFKVFIHKTAWLHVFFIREGQSGVALFLCLCVSCIHAGVLKVVLVFLCVPRGF